MMRCCVPLAFPALTTGALVSTLAQCIQMTFGWRTLFRC
jgi:hypothetical protein